MEYNAEQWNAANAQAVEQSNITWRRNTNTAETAAQNGANQQTAAFTFNMDTASQSQMWNELRDTASYNRQAYENERNRLIGVVSSALSNEAFMTDDSFGTQRKALFDMLNAASTGVAQGSEATSINNRVGRDADGNEYLIGKDANGNIFNRDSNNDGILDFYIDENYIAEQSKYQDMTG
jgi:hypothetical protein